MITLEETESYASLLERAREHESLARSFRESAHRLGVDLLPRVRAGERQAPGGPVLSIGHGSKRPAWKEEFIRELGEAAAQTVIDRTDAPETLQVGEVVAVQIKRGRKSA